MARSAQSSARPSDLVGALKSGALAAIVAFGLFSLLIGIRTDQGPTGALELEPRLLTLGAFMAVAFVGGFLRAWIAGERVDFTGYLPDELKAAATQVGRFFGLALLAFAIVEPIVFYNNRYVLDLGIT